MLRDKAKQIRFLLITAITVGVFAVLLLPIAAAAQIEVAPTEFAAEIELGKLDLRLIIARIIRVFLGILGVVAVILIIYGGFTYMTAAGDPEKIAKARSILTGTIVGLIIILASFSITQFIISRLQAAIFGIRQEILARPSVPGMDRLSGSLGAGVLKSHIPDRGQAVCRNMNIAITFKEPIFVPSMITDKGGPTDDTAPDGVFGNNGDEIKYSNIQITAEKEAESVLTYGRVTDDHKTFVFDPIELLGNPDETVPYTVTLVGGDLGIKKEEAPDQEGSPAFSGRFSEGYKWTFRVDPCIDNTPPKIKSVIPLPGAEEPRNTIVQINFDEAVDPTSGSGITAPDGSGFQNIRVFADGSRLAGTFEVVNQYQTIEFISDNPCGTNSCGDTIYCLPGDADIDVLILAAAVAEAPMSTGFPYDGIVDMVGNSLDGDRDGTAEGPQSQNGQLPYVWGMPEGDPETQGDDVTWPFSTTNDIDISAPAINEVEPAIGAERVSPEAMVRITFSKTMMLGTLSNENIGIKHTVPDDAFNPPYELWYSVRSDNTWNPFVSATTTLAGVRHGPFAPSPDPPTPGYLFSPIVSSRVKDTRQNCYIPPVGPGCDPGARAAGEYYCCPTVDPTVMQWQAAPCKELTP